MSAFGPALFARRLDKKEIGQEEADALLELVRRAADDLRLKDDGDDPVEPRRCEGEPGAVGVLIYSSYAYLGMPEEIRADQDESWKELGQKIVREIERALPNTYSFDCYTVED